MREPIPARSGQRRSAARPAQVAAMPSGLNAMIVVQAYGLDLKITANALVWTTAIVVPVALVASFVT